MRDSFDSVRVTDEKFGGKPATELGAMDFTPWTLEEDTGFLEPVAALEDSLSHSSWLSTASDARAMMAEDHYRERLKAKAFLCWAGKTLEGNLPPMFRDSRSLTSNVSSV